MIWKLSGEEKILSFTGAYANHVALRLFPHDYAPANHVVVLPYYQHHFLFAKHTTRGYEWPGGKIEQGESALEAALREVKEETGAILSSIWKVGQYTVTEPERIFTKNIYVALVEQIIKRDLAIDSKGYVLVPVETMPKEAEGYSPLVCDGVYEAVKKHVYLG